MRFSFFDVLSQYLLEMHERSEMFAILLAIVSQVGNCKYFCLAGFKFGLLNVNCFQDTMFWICVMVKAFVSTSLLLVYR